MYLIRDLNVHLALYYGGEEIKIAGNGKVGYLESGRSAQLEITFPTDSAIWPIRVDGQKNVVMARNDSEVNGVVLVRTAIQIKESQSGVAHTQYPDNHIRLLRRVDADKFEHWEIALVSQNGIFWVTAQKTYDITCGRDNKGRFLCPQFRRRWPQMVKFLAKLLKDEELPVVARAAKKDEVDITGLATNQGIVLWWNSAQQLGAIATKKGNARVHWSQIIVADGLRHLLVPGKKVTFHHLRQPKVTPGGRQTTFQKEAVGVKMITS